ncbi:MAG: TRAP transporter substrate-binding protein, partial [Alphaproteobacteria bacterium]|nr:TRAP transporter substrate-binding protein [Alphaproteobacteria bacterium]
RRARAAEFTLKYAHNSQTTHPLHIRTSEAAERIKQATGGKVEVQIFPNNQLGGDTDMLSQVRSGAIDFFTISGAILATLVPIASINGIGFAFKSYDDVWPAMDGELGAYVRTAVAKANLHCFEKMYDNGYRQMTSSTKPITTAADLKGFKIRVPVSPLWTSMFKAFGASPASINFAEVYSALQTKIVEGQENPLAIIETAKLYEVQKYLATTNHMWDGFWMLANARSFNGLPKDVQGVITTEFNKSALDQRVDVKKLNDTLEDTLKAKGMVFNKPDPASFRDQLAGAGFYKEWREKYGPEGWAMLEKYAGKLG